MTPESMEAGLADDLHAVRSVKGREDIAMFRDMLRCNKFWADLCTKFDAAKEFHAEYSAEMHSARIRFGGHLPMDAETVQVMTQRPSRLGEMGGEVAVGRMRRHPRRVHGHTRFVVGWLCRRDCGCRGEAAHVGVVDGTILGGRGASVCRRVAPREAPLFARPPSRSQPMC